MRQAADEAAAAALRFEALQAEHVTLQDDYLALDAVRLVVSALSSALIISPKSPPN